MPLIAGFRSPLFLDSDDQNLGNSPGADSRGRLHVKVSNQSTEPIPVSITTGASGAPVNTFDTQSNVLPSVETVISSYTVPAGKKFHLYLVEFSGTNIGEYNLYADAVQIAQRRTNFGSNLSDQMIFSPGLDFVSGQVLALKVINPRPNAGDYSARIQGLNE